MEAVWIDDYDLHTDKLYKRPGCPACHEPCGVYDDGKYHCFSCGEVISVTDKDMLDWLAARSERKVTLEDDPLGCGGKKCVETYWVRNKVTLEWQIAYGICKKCGSCFIV